MKTLLKRDQVYDEIRGRIARGNLKPGQQLPQGVELARQIGVSHITLRAAFKRLAADGLIESIHGRGTFIARHPGQTAFRVVGLILPSLRKPLTVDKAPMQYALVSNLIHSVEERHMEIRTLHRKRQGFDSRAMGSMGVDGIIVIYPHSSDAGLLVDLKATGLPLLLFNLLDPGLNRWHHCLNMDYARMAADTVTRFHAQGRRNIAFVTCYDPQPALHPGLLLQGYLARMAAIGLPPLIVQAASLPYGQLDPREVADLLRAQLPKLRQADAILTTHIPDGLAVMNLLRKQGRRIPGDTAVIGCFDSPAAESGGLSTWRIPWETVSRNLLDGMETLMRAPDRAPEIVLLPGEEVRRKSG